MSELIVLNLITYLITYLIMLLEPDSEDDKMAMPSLSEDQLVEGMFHKLFFCSILIFPNSI